MSIIALKKDVVLPIELHTPEAASSIPNPPGSDEVPLDEMDVQISSEHVTSEKGQLSIKCNECDSMFDSKDGLDEHTSLCHTLRGTKRTPEDTSLLLEPPKSCSSCDDSIKKLTRSYEEQSLTKAAYDTAKLTLDEKLKELSDKTNQVLNLQNELNKIKSEANKKQSENVNANLKDEYEIVKQMVIDKDKVIKSLREKHEKELAALKIDKKASEEALGCATRENVAMKDKESTLIDIFKRMKTYIENYHDHDKQLATLDKPNEVYSPSKCEKCEQSFTSELTLKEHVEATHKKFTCEHCNYSDFKEVNVENHMVTLHSEFKCHLCNFVSNSGESLDKHLTSEHFKPNI